MLSYVDLVKVKHTYIYLSQMHVMPLFMLGSLIETSLNNFVPLPTNGLVF